jgi:hypothetical protein
MAMVCPRCATATEQLLQCPGCGDPLPFAGGPPAVALGRDWQHRPWGRIAIGLLLAQGLFYGLRHLSAGLSLAVQGDATSGGTELGGLLLTQALQAAALLAGGILAGSGQRNGALLGAVVGVWNGVLVGVVPQSAGQPFSTVAIYGDPLLQGAIGALAGWLGGAIWRPLPGLQPRGPLPTARKAPPRRRLPLFAGRVARVRVVLGTAVAVSGALSTTVLFEAIVRISNSGPAGNGTILDQLVTWEIRALALLVGGALAGCNTSNGLKQGLCVGLASALLLGALEPRGVDRWLELIGLLLVSCTSLCLVGGWFGSQLFPPIVAYRRRRLETMSMV